MPDAKPRAAKQPRAAKPRAAKPSAVRPSAAASARAAEPAVEPNARVTKVRAGAAPSRSHTPPPPARTAGPLGTAVQAAAELTEIGLMASARALRGALSRLPRP
jgi:hypothetical protein